MKLIKLVAVWSGLLVGVLSITAYAGVQNPTLMLKQTVSTLQHEMQQQGVNASNNPKALYLIVKRVLMPQVAVNQMAGLALGPKWRTATPAERSQFVDQFGLMLTRTYASALLKVSDYKVHFYPLRGDGWQTLTQVAVSGAITPQSGGAISHVTYYLERDGEGWKIYDMSIEGVSLLKNFRSQFDAFSTMPVLLGKMKQLNGQS